MPRTKKAAGQAVDSRNGRRLVLDGDVSAGLAYFSLPPRSPAFLASSVEAWEAVFTDPIAQAWTVADKPILLRWIDAVDRAVRALRRADRTPVVKGAYDQLTEHPSYATAARALAVAEKCEQQLGFGALNRERLGFTIASARKTMAEVNALYLEGGDDDEPDPRRPA